MYADDTHLTYASNNIHNIQTSLKEDLENVHNWLRANKLTLNMTKTEFMLIGSRQRLSTVTVTPTLAINDFRTLTSIIAITVWGNCGITFRNKQQKRAARVFTFSNYDEDAAWLPV